MFSYVLIGSGNWQQVPGGLTHVSVGSHFVWGVNVHNSIYRCALPCSGGWVHVAGGLREIDVGETEVWATHSWFGRDLGIRDLQQVWATCKEE